MTTYIGAASRLASIAIASALFATASLTAQSHLATPVWEAWIGCWQPVDYGDEQRPAGTFVCLLPTSSRSAIELASVDSGRIVSRDTIDANGERSPLAVQGCTGWRRAEWSADERRVYLHSELACPGALTRTSTGIMAMSPVGDLIDIQSASAGGNAGVRARVLRSVVGTSGLPAEVVAVVRTQSPSVRGARLIASSPVSIASVIEATKQLDSNVVASWLIERGQPFDLSARQLIALADAGVPGSVTDVMIGVSYPDHFVVAGSPNEGDSVSPAARTGGDSTRAVSRYATRGCMSSWDPTWYDPYGYDPYYDSCMSRYSYRGYYGVGYRTYGYGYSTGYYYPGYGQSYYPPVIIVRGEATPHGRVVKGRGYTKGRDSDGSDTPPANPPRQSVGADRSSSGKSSSGSSTSGSSSGGSSSNSGRTAHKKGGQ